MLFGGSKGQIRSTAAACDAIPDLTLWRRYTFIRRVSQVVDQELFTGSILFALEAPDRLSILKVCGDLSNIRFIQIA